MNMEKQELARSLKERHILPILAITSLVPWNQLDDNSPFVSVFSAIGIPYVGDIMNFVMLTAVLSAANTGMYATSRMLYTQATDGEAPRFFAKLSKNKVPARAMLASTSFLYIGVVIAFFAKGHTFDYLMMIPGYSIMIVWMLMLVAHLKSRRGGIDVHEYHVKAFPVTSWIALIALIVIFVAVVVTSPVLGTLVAAFAMGLVALSYKMVNVGASETNRNETM